MEQASTPLDNADTDEQGIAVWQQQYFSTADPVKIAAWVKKHKPELALLMGMGLTSFLISGAAMAVLLSPNLGQKLTYEPLIDDATLAASRRLSLGELLLGQVARVLEIEIIETQGPELGRHSRATPAMTIVAQADKAASMPEADLATGLKAMVVAAGVGLGVTGLMRLVPLIPFSALGPRRRQPLSQRLKPTDVVSHQPLAPITSPGRPTGRSQALMPGALTSLAVSDTSLLDGLTMAASAAAPAIPRRRARENSTPQQHRSPSVSLRRRLAQRKDLGRDGISRVRPDSPGSQVSGGAQAGSGNKPAHHPRSPASAQPVSFVCLNASADSVLIPDSPSRTALWSNSSSGTADRQVPATTAQFDFLDKLDVRRQYPLDSHE